MAYATVEDIISRCRRDLSESEKTLCEKLIDDATIIVDVYNANASHDKKNVVTCNMIIRLLGDSDNTQLPIGATQGTVSALGYSQTFTMGSGSSGELYLSKLDKKILGIGNKIRFVSSLENNND